MPPPRSSDSSSSLLSVLRQQRGSNQSPVYTSPTDRWGFPLPGAESHNSSSSLGTSINRHHPPEDEGNSNLSSTRNVLQCNRNHNFMEYERRHDQVPPPDGINREGGTQDQRTQEMLNNNMDPEQPGPSYYQPVYSGENPSPSHLNRCRVCHNPFSHNQGTQRWERTSQATSGGRTPAWQTTSPTYHNSTPQSDLHLPERRSMEPSTDVPESGVPFSHSAASGQSEEQDVGMVFNQETGPVESFYRQSATSHSMNVSQETLNHEMPEDEPDHDYLSR